jgi:hypothetical protein
MTSASSFRKCKYGLNQMQVGEVRKYHNLSERERGLLRRSAHNLNLRSSLYFTTRYREGVMTITRVR